MSKVEVKYIKWRDIPEKSRLELTQEADLTATSDIDSRIVLYQATMNNIIVVNQGLGENPDPGDREHSAELVEFVSSVFDHDTDWYIVE